MSDNAISPGDRAQEHAALYLAAMQAPVFRITYDFERRLGIVWVPVGFIPAMAGTVAFFLKLDPTVRMIQVVIGDARDTVFLLRGDRWVSSKDTP